MHDGAEVGGPVLPRRRLLVHIGMSVAVVLIVTIGFFGVIRLIPDGPGPGPRTGGSQVEVPSGSPTGASSPGPAEPAPRPRPPPDTGRERRTVTLGGPTTDNLYPRAAFDLRKEDDCVLLRNGTYDLPVLVWDIRVEPKEPAAFAFGGPGGCQDLPPCLGRTLPEQAKADSECAVAIEVLGERGFETDLLLRLRTVCHDSGRHPCSDERVRPAPTGADPVTVEWTAYQVLRPQELISPSAPPTTGPATTAPAPTSPDGGVTTAPTDPGTGDG